MNLAGIVIRNRTETGEHGYVCQFFQNARPSGRLPHWLRYSRHKEKCRLGIACGFLCRDVPIDVVYDGRHLLAVLRNALRHVLVLQSSDSRYSGNRPKNRRAQQIAKSGEALPPFVLLCLISDCNPADGGICRGVSGNISVKACDGDVCRSAA